MKTSELSGAQLDWAVFEAEYGAQTYEFTDAYKPSKDWAQGGSIIEREGISLDYIGVGEGIRVSPWYATKWLADNLVSRGEGSTPLVAAMRCYVASKLGQEVEIPEELK
jgi:hypothetical protein